MTSIHPLQKNNYCIDAHADTLRNCIRFKRNFLAENSGNHLDLPQLETAHWNLQFMAAFTPPYPKRSQATLEAEAIFKEAYRLTEEAPNQLRIITSPSDLDDQNRLGILLSLEGADPLDYSLERFQDFFERGCRAIGLTHNHNSCAAGGCAPPDDTTIGLTDFGKQLIPEMERLGCLVDTAHLGRQAFFDLMDIISKPLINSHCCCAKFVNIERNLTDEQVKLIGATGGVVAVTYVPKFLAPDERNATTRTVFEHLDHMVELVGIDHVGLGSDYDGIPSLPPGLETPSGVSRIIEHMLDAGWPEEGIIKVLGENFARILRHTLPQKELQIW